MHELDPAASTDPAPTAARPAAPAADAGGAHASGGRQPRPRELRGAAWARLYERGRRRGGVVDVHDAVAEGLDPRAYQRRIRDEDWWRPFDGDVAVLPGAGDGARVQVAAALHLLGSRAAASHGTAMWLHGLWSGAPSTITVSVPVDRAPRARPGLQVVRTRTLRQADVVDVDGVRCTSVARTLRDVAGRLSDDGLRAMLTTAEQRRLVDLPTLLEQAALPGTARGAGRFRRMVELRRRDRWDSGLERDGAALFRAHGFTPHHGPFPVRCPDGRVVHVDVAFPAVRLAVECDGIGYHSDPASFETDRIRWQQLAAAGWQVIWLTRVALRDRPLDLVAQVRAVHLRAGIGA